MIPYGSEGRERIEKHRRMRAGKGFITVEAPYDICDAVEKCSKENGFELGDMTVLLECVSNLVANELFEKHADRDGMLDRLSRDISRLADMADNLVIVSNHFQVEDSFDEETRMYAETLDILNERLSKIADNTIRL
jgi:adenosylcobinamide kinase/adenosylcobinamide-phosphate guanylyltransferase